VSLSVRDEDISKRPYTSKILPEGAQEKSGKISSSHQAVPAWDLSSALPGQPPGHMAAMHDNISGLDTLTRRNHGGDSLSYKRTASLLFPEKMLDLTRVLHAMLKQTFSSQS